MLQRLIDAAREDSLTSRWDETNKQLARIADVLERIAPQVAEEATGDNAEVFIDEYTPESEPDESVGLDEAHEGVRTSG